MHSSNKIRGLDADYTGSNKGAQKIHDARSGCIHTPDIKLPNGGAGRPEPYYIPGMRGPAESCPLLTLHVPLPLGLIPVCALLLRKALNCF